MNSDTQTITIRAAYDEVFNYIANPERLPEWSPEFAPVMRRDGERWLIVRGTREVELKVATNAQWGLIDFHTEMVPGVPSVAYSRVVPNGLGSEYIFTQFQGASQPDEAFLQQRKGMRHELITLKGLLEA